MVVKTDLPILRSKFCFESSDHELCFRFCRRFLVLFYSANYSDLFSLNEMLQYRIYLSCLHAAIIF